jgi:hypothetical protein
VLLVGAGLFPGTLRRLSAPDLEYAAEHWLTFRVAMHAIELVARLVLEVLGATRPEHRRTSRRLFEEHWADPLATRQRRDALNRHSNEREANTSGQCDCENVRPLQTRSPNRCAA